MVMIKQICRKCEQLKKLQEFHKHIRYKSGYRTTCKICAIKDRHEYYQKNIIIEREKARLYGIKYYSNNRSKILEKEKERWRNNLEENRAKERERHKRRYPKEKEKRKEYAIKYLKENKLQRQETIRKYYQNNKYNPKFKLRLNFSKALHTALKKNKQNQSWENLVGYNLNVLKEHLERQFKGDMSWDNYGKWHIDHIKPVSSFNFKSHKDTDFKKCWSLNNLQPLWAKENLEKGAIW